MANLKNVIYLSNEDYETSVSTGTVTIDGETLTYDENNVYITPDKLASTTEDGLMSSTDKVKLDSIESGAQVNPSAYLKTASVSGSTLTLTKQDDTTVTFTVPDASMVVSVDLGSDPSTATGTLTADELTVLTNGGLICGTDSNSTKYYCLPSLQIGSGSRSYILQFVDAGTSFLVLTSFNIRVNMTSGAWDVVLNETYFYSKSQSDTLLNDKVDKVSGKGLSTNDFTTDEKNKLAGIEAGAEVNVQADWTQTTITADDYIKNKPTLATVATSGSYNDLTDKPTIPTVNDGTLSIQGNGTTASTFTANQSTNTTLNIKGANATTVSKTADNEITISTPAESHVGDVVSVGATSGSHIAIAGTFANPTVGVASGYSIPSTTDQTSWTNKYSKPSTGIPASDLAESYYLASNPNGYTSNTGTVTSVDLSMPTGFSVSGSPITSSGTLTASFSSGYSLLNSNSEQEIAGDKKFTDAVKLNNSLNPLVFYKTDIFKMYTADTSEYTYTLPYNSGTIALTSDIPAVLSTGTSNKDKFLHTNASTGALEWSSVTSGPTTYLKSASVSSNTLTLTKQDNTTVIYTPSFTDTNYYPTAFSWTNGTTAGPTGSLTGTGMSAVSFGAIPAASSSQSGIVTTGPQNFSGKKQFDNGLVVNENNANIFDTSYFANTGANLAISGHISIYGDNDNGNSQKPLNTTDFTDLDTILFNTGITLVNVDDETSLFKLQFPGKSGVFAVTDDIQNVELVDLTSL